MCTGYRDGVGKTGVMQWVKTGVKVNRLAGFIHHYGNKYNSTADQQSCTVHWLTSQSG